MHSKHLSWREPGDAFVARRLLEAVAPGERAGATVRAGDAWLTVVATHLGVARIDLSHDERELPDGVKPEPGLADLAASLARCLDAWEPRVAELPLDVTGTRFQLDVWRALRGIRPGRTSTYGAVALEIGRAAASRAVGQAVGANPVPIAVPCHRVLARGGAIGGFACGIPMKRRLLRAEGIDA